MSNNPLELSLPKIALDKPREVWYNRELEKMDENDTQECALGWTKPDSAGPPDDKAAPVNEENEYGEPLTAGGCTLSQHIELTRGLGKFDSRQCPRCHLSVYRP